MPRQFPEQTDQAVNRADDPSILYLNEQQSHEIVKTLSTNSAYDIFCRLTCQPGTASEIADEMDITIQNVGYHLENMEEINLIEVVDTCYSDKGREMDVYAATSDQKILVLGTEDEQADLKDAFRTLAGAIGAPAILIAFWKVLSDGLEAINPE